MPFAVVYSKFFKYLSFVPRLDAIVLTVQFAMLDLLLFSAIAAFVIFSYASAFYVCLGKDLAAFIDLGTSAGSLMRFLLGDFNYLSMLASNSVMTPFLFFVYQLVMFFVLLNM